MAQGDLADFEELVRIIEEKVRADSIAEELATEFTPKSLYAWIQAIMYNRRSNMDPFWLTVTVAGYDDKPFLGVIDQLGVCYEAPHTSTGFGGYLAGPFIELNTPEDAEKLDREEAEKQIKKSYHSC